MVPHSSARLDLCAPGFEPGGPIAAAELKVHASVLAGEASALVLDLAEGKYDGEV
jgi:hypothetical protein